MSKKTTPPELDGCRYVEFLGEGGFADVYKYEQFGRFVAVKVLHNSLGSDNQRAFEAEARTMGKLSEHPNVVSIYGVGRTPSGSAYLIMEYCPPPNLAVRIREQREPYSVAKTLQTGIQIAGAVESAHRLHILHRDIKPANILITAYNRPALTDFGIASALDDHSAHSEGVSVPWAPPEQLTSGTPLTPSADVYALAATLWTLLAGRSPFERLGGPNDTLSLSKRVRTEPPPRIGRHDVPESLERALHTALAKKADERYASAEAFARALQAVEAELHLPQTILEAIEVVGPDGRVDPEPKQRSGTRVVGFVSIDPDPESPPTQRGAGVPGPERTRPGFAGEQSDTSPQLRGTHAGRRPAPEQEFIARGFPTEDVAQTVIRQAQPHVGGADHGAGSQVPPADAGAPGSRRSGLAIAMIAAALGLLVVAITVTPLRASLGFASPSSSHSTTSATPADPLAAQRASPVSGLEIRAKGKLVEASWTGPALNQGEEYLYTFYRPDDPDAGPIRHTTSRRVTSNHAGEDCVSVMVGRSDGTSSEPERACL